MTSPFTFLLALQSALTTALNQTPFLLPSRIQTEGLGFPQVYINDLPYKDQNQAEPDPFVLLRVLSGYEEDGQHHVSLAVIVGVYNSESFEAVENDLITLLHGVRQCLHSYKYTALEQRYQLLPDEKGRELPWEKPEQQSFPYHRAHILTQWAMKGWE